MYGANLPRTGICDCQYRDIKAIKDITRQSNICLGHDVALRGNITQVCQSCDHVTSFFIAAISTIGQDGGRVVALFVLKVVHKNFELDLFPCLRGS